MFNLNKISTDDLTYLSNSRSIALLKQAYQSIKKAIVSIENDIPIDMVEMDLKDAWDKLGEIIGKTYQEELIDQLFSQFCLGK